jgi:uncharacterized alkaline shock family protein YloU
MKVFLHIVLSLFALCVMAIATVFIVITVRHDFLEIIYNYISNVLLPDVTGSVIVVVVSVFAFITGFIFIVTDFKKKRELLYVSRKSEYGEVKISLDTIENITLATAKKAEGVKETRALIKKIEDSVDIVIKLLVLAEVNIPDLSKEIQETVKTSVEENSGISVNNIEVFVENIVEETDMIKRI